MRFITYDANTVVVRSEIPAIVNEKGQMLHPKKPRLYAKFTRGIPTPFVAKAQEKFPKWDRPERPLAQFGGYCDTEAEQAARGWSDEERNLIEEILLTRPQLLQVDFAKAPLPYPTYIKQRKVQGKRTVEHVVTDIKATLEQTGLDAESVIAYETDHADEHSAAIIAALTPVEIEPEPEEQLVTA